MAVVMERGAYVRMLTAVYAALFLIRVAFGVVLVTFPLYVQQGAGVLGLLSAASPLLELITIFFAPWFIARYGRKGILLTGLALGAVSLYGLALTRNPILLGGIYAVHGVASGFILVTTLAVIATYAQPEHRGREMGIFNFVNIFGLVGGYVAGVALERVFQEQLEYTFVIAGALATLGLLYANRVIRLPAEERSATAERPRFRRTVASMTSGRILLLTLPWLIVWMLVAAVLAFSSRVTDALKVDTGATVVSVLVVGGLLVFAQLFWGRMADRHGKEIIMLVGAAGLMLLMGTVVYAFFSTSASDLTGIFDAVLSHRILLAVFLFTALAFAPAGLAAIADEAEGGAEGSAMSAYALTLSLGFIIGPPVVGFIADFDATRGLGGRMIVVFFAALAGLLLALVLTHYVRQRRSSRPAAEASP
jgi:MFS family permease